MTTTLEEKTIIITGANSGIGKAAAVQLAKTGAKVILACRSTEKGLQAMEEVKKASSNLKVEFLRLDLASQQSVHDFAQAFLKNYKQLDVLIHNAANFDLTMKQPVITPDGVETIFATNHLGPFLLTHLLLYVLKASAPSRIITIASKGLIAYPFLNIEFDNLNGERNYSPQHAYYHSKLAQVMFTFDLAERLNGTGVTVNCVRVTNVAFPDEKLIHLPEWQRKIYAMKRKMAITPEKQAETYTFLASDPSVQAINGGYWDENNRQVTANKSAYRRETWKKLWEVSEKMNGL